MTMQRRVTLHSKESAIVRCVIADSKHYIVKKVSPHALATVQQWTRKN